jgi:predicted DNA-binding protein (UPF0251 family)
MLKGRPRKQRIISGKPQILQFSPRGRRGRPDYVRISPDEFEAIRLSDFVKSPQVHAAKHMGISQQTFSRTLNRARRLLADALINGKIIRIVDENNAKIQAPSREKPTDIQEEGYPKAG